MIVTAVAFWVADWSSVVVSGRSELEYEGSEF